MRRSRLEALLQDHAAGDLDEARGREVERLLESDPAARALHAEILGAQAALRLLRERPEPPVAARDAFPAIQAAIAAQAFEARPRLFLEGLGTRYYRRLAIAATLLCALTVGFFAFRGSGPEGGGGFPAPLPDLSVKSALDLGREREGIPAEEFLRFLATTRNPSELRVYPAINVIEISESK